MTNSNRIKLTWISFLSYALTGALVIVTGMVMGNTARFPPVIYRLLLQYGWDDFPNDRRVSTGAQH